MRKVTTNLEAHDKHSAYGDIHKLRLHILPIFDLLTLHWQYPCKWVCTFVTNTILLI